MFLIAFLPLFYARFVIRKNFSAIGVLQDVFASIQLSFLGPFACIAYLLALYDALIQKKLGYRLDLKMVSFLKDIGDFKDSAKDIGIFKNLAFYSLIALLPGFFSIHFEPYLLLFGLPLLFIKPDSMLIRWEAEALGSLFSFFKRPTSHNFSLIKKTLIRKSEESSFISEEYPLFRYTTGFKGEKAFDMETSDKPHIVLLFVESLRKKDLSRLPNLNKLSKQSYFFPNYYSNSVLTFRAIFTALMGIPYDLDIAWEINPEIKACGLPALKKKGYTQNFYTGATWGFNGVDVFLKHQEVDHIIDRRGLNEHFGKLDESSWGVSDEYLFQYCLDHLEKNQKTPQFYSLLTITSHHPWKVPPTYEGPCFEEEGSEYSSKYLQTLHYTDRCIGNFIEKLKEKNLSKDVVFLITGDHGVYFGDQDKNFETKRGVHEDNFHVPLMIYGDGRVQNPGEISTMSSHCDLVPTLMDLFQLEGYQHSIGKSLLRKDMEAPVFYHNPSLKTDGVQCKNGSSEMVNDFKKMMKTLFKGNALIPKMMHKVKEPINPSLFIPPPCDTKALLMSKVKNNSPMLSLYLRNQMALDNGFLEWLPEINPSLQELFINDSYRVTDEGIKHITQKCKFLEKLMISHCPLLTEQCLRSVPQILLELNLKGSPITFNHRIKDLRFLNVQDTPFSEKELYALEKNCPHLDALFISYANFTGSVIKKGIANLPLRSLKVNECDLMKDHDVEDLVKPHLYLRFLFLERCYSLSDDLYLKMQGLNIRHLSICNYINLTDKGLEGLLKLPLDCLEIKGAPNLTYQGFALIEKYQEKFSKLKINS